MPGKSLLEALDWNSRNKPDKWAFTFLTKEVNETSVTYQQLTTASKNIATHLLNRFNPGDRAILLFPPGLDFIKSFLGCLYAGVVAVPVNVGKRKEEMDRLISVINDARPVVLLGPIEIFHKYRQLGLSRITEDNWLDPRFLSALNQDLLASSARNGLAFIQYTSGSTAKPKGVELTHSNLASNQEMIADAFEHNENTVVGGWLPLHHDMGLIGNILQTIWLGSSCYLMSPLEFMQTPVNWLKMIGKYRITSSGGPNFAYDYCVRRIKDKECSGLELQTWNLAFNGAEPIRLQVMQKFHQKFKRYGFDFNAFYPCYGLAEGTLFVSGTKKGKIDSTSLKPGAYNNEVADKWGGSRHLYTSCGHTRRGLTLKCINPDTCIECQESEVGEIWLNGSSITNGYWEKPLAEGFNGKIVGDETQRHYFRTGDLGFLEAGRLYVVGRIKDLIIIRGKNYFAEDIEQDAESVYLDKHGGKAVAFSVVGENGEELALVCEIGGTRLPQDVAHVIKEKATEVVALRHGLRVSHFCLVSRGKLQRTTSGKIKRFLVKKDYLNGSLHGIPKVTG